MLREAALDWISVLKSTDIRKLAKDPLTPDFPVPNAVADTLPAPAPRMPKRGCCRRSEQTLLTLPPRLVEIGIHYSNLRAKMELLSRFFQIPEHSCFLFGPRGTGKSTWLKSELPDSLYLDLLEPGLHRRLEARSERLRELIAGMPEKRAGVTRTVVIDEIQRIPELLNVVHAVLEEPTPPRFMLTGSSARKLRRGGVNLLGGRAAHRTMHPFMAAEMPEFELAQALDKGMLPLVASARDPNAVLDAYAGLYLEQEVRAEGLTRNVGAFARFLEAIAFAHGSLLNISSVARDCEVERKVVDGYVGILEDLLLSFRLPVFRKRAKRATVRHEKLYLFDAGVFRSLRPKGPLDRPEEIDGQAVEGLVAQHLRAWAAYSAFNARIFFWRTRAGAEVDFVVYGDSGLQAIEVKNSARVRPEDLRSLKAFREDYPEAEAAILYRGRERLRSGGVSCLPLEEFLRSVVPDRALLMC